MKKSQRAGRKASPPAPTTPVASASGATGGESSTANGGAGHLANNANDGHRNAASLPPTPPSLFDRLVDSLPVWALVVVAIFGIRRLDDFDTWWHLASGRWIFQNHSIPSTDVLSFTVPTNEWINLQWLYDLLLFAVWSLGGANALVLASTLCFVATFALLARHLRRFVGPVPTTLLLIWVAATVNERFLIRPEMASFPLLAAVGLVLQQGRATPARLRWLVPLMMAWASLHSLFILGVAAIVSAMVGAWVAELPILPANWRLDSSWPAAARRQLMIWGGAALAATLVNPYFVRAVLFPLELMSRIDGSSDVYSSIGEFRRPFSGYFPTFAIGSYQFFLLTFVVLVILAGMVRAFSRRPRRGAEPVVSEYGYDIGALAFALALAWLSLLARRNIGVFAVGTVPVVAACAGILLSLFPAAWTRTSSWLSRAAAVATVGVALTICGAVISNHWYAVTGETHEFGLGVFESNFQPRATAFFREQNLPGPTYNDMTAGGYLTWDEPSGKGVYIDGRLEVYDTSFFSAYLDNLADLAAWEKDADARGIQSVMVFHRWGNRHSFLRELIATQQWMLVYFDETAAIVVRAVSNSEAIAKAREAFTKTWRPRTDALLGAANSDPSWRWSINRYTAQIAYARVLETFNEGSGAQKWFEEALATGLPKEFAIETGQRAAQYQASAGNYAQARVTLEAALLLDPEEAGTRMMLRKLNEISK